MARRCGRNTCARPSKNESIRRYLGLVCGCQRQGSTQPAGYIRLGAAKIEPNEISDLEYSWRVREAFQDQPFSLVDRTSFAMMERLQISKVVTFDDDFVIYRYGPDRRQAFEVLR